MRSALITQHREDHSINSTVYCLGITFSIGKFGSGIPSFPSVLSSRIPRPIKHGLRMVAICFTPGTVNRCIIVTGTPHAHSRKGCKRSIVAQFPRELLKFKTPRLYSFFSFLYHSSQRPLICFPRPKVPFYLPLRFIFASSFLMRVIFCLLLKGSIKRSFNSSNL